jgi:hypothetical protein
MPVRGEVRSFYTVPESSRGVSPGPIHQQEESIEIAEYAGHGSLFSGRCTMGPGDKPRDDRGGVLGVWNNSQFPV